MPRKGRSDTRERIFTYIKRFIRSRGYAPTVRDILRGCNLSSTAVVQHHLNVLESEGRIHRDLQRVVVNFAKAGLAMDKALPEDATIATLPIGALGFFSGRRIHDMMGLVEPKIAHMKLDMTKGVIGHQKYDHAYTLSTRPEAIVVAAYGQKLGRRLLELPERGCINVHASLLPRYRGAAPIAAAMLAGDAHTGVTIMQMTEAMDAGDILAQRATPIAPDENAGQLHDRLARLGAELLVETLIQLERGDVVPQPQDHSRATFAPKLSKADGALDFTRNADTLARVVRALTPWPGAAARLHLTQQGKDLAVRVLAASAEPGAPAEPGLVIRPIHRVVHSLEGFDPDRFLKELEGEFRVEPLSSLEEAQKRLAEGLGVEHVFVVYLPGGRFYAVSLKDEGRIPKLVPGEQSLAWKSLDVSILHKAVLERILKIDEEKLAAGTHVSYTPYREKAVEAVERGEGQLAILLNPTRVEEVMAVASQGERMPQKSTDFYPKLLTGLVAMRMEIEK